MQKVYRQDGTEVELDDSTAEQWIKRGLATAPPVAVEAQAKPNWSFKKTPEPIQTIEGE